MEKTFVRHGQPDMLDEARMRRLLDRELACVRQWAASIGLKYDLDLDLDPLMATRYPSGSSTTTFSGGSADDNSIQQDDWADD
jgi:hypothetical protein